MNKQNEPVVFDFLVYRQEGLTPSCFTRVVLKFEPDLAPPQTPDGQIILNERIQEGVEAWVKATDNGRAVYGYAGDDLNFGDLAGYEDEVSSFILGCAEFRLESMEVSGHFTYDTSLCGSLEV
jgi:hypothetical protein